MSAAPVFLMQAFPGIEQGDLWRVTLEGDFARFERVQAEPGTFRKRGDGLWPPLPDARPISDEEARALAAEMEAAMQRGRACLEAWPFSPDNPLNQALTTEDACRLLAEGARDAAKEAWARSGKG